MTRQLSIAFVLAMALGCSAADGEGLQVVEVSPSCAKAGVQTPLMITGADFDPMLYRDMSCGAPAAIGASSHFSAELYDTAGVRYALADVVLLDQSSLRATMSADVPVGRYAVRLLGPSGTDTLQDAAVEVSATGVCAVSEPGEDTDTQMKPDSDTGTDTSDTGTDTSDTGTDTSDTGTDTSDTGTDTSDTGTDTSDTGTDTGAVLSACELAMRVDPRIICCPETLPATCNPSGWTWDTVAHDPIVGCCTADLESVMHCATLNIEDLLCEDDLAPVKPGFAMCAPSPTPGDPLICARTSCASPITIDLVTNPGPIKWTGRWDDYASKTVELTSGACDLTNLDIWFAVIVPAHATLRVLETDVLTDAVIRWLESCTATTCLSYGDSFTLGRLDIHSTDDSPTTLLVTVSSGKANVGPGPELDFSLLP